MTGVVATAEDIRATLASDLLWDQFVGHKGFICCCALVSPLVARCEKLLMVPDYGSPGLGKKATQSEVKLH
jgi:hypothetical protein